MRIVHADTDDIQNPLRGGQPVRTYEVNKRLAKTNDVTVFTATYPGATRQVTRDNINYQCLGITIPRWGLSSHLSYLNRLPAAIKRTPHDLIVEEFTPPFGFCNLQKVSSKPLISIVQWFFFEHWQARYKLPFEDIMRQRANQFSPRNLIVQTNKMGEYFQALLPNANIVKVPCGINADAFMDQYVPGDYALFLGRLDTQHKGLDDLLWAWSDLAKSGIRIPLWIVGTGQDEAKLKVLATKFNIDDLVIFKGRLEGADKNVAIKQCRLLVMPSRQETFGITALEAMAMQKPVVAYDIDHLNELLQPAWSSCVTLGNKQVLANAVAALWQNPAHCEQFGKQAYVAAKQYLWEEIAKKQLQVYLDVVKKRE